MSKFVKLKVDTPRESGIVALINMDMVLYVNPSRNDKNKCELYFSWHSEPMTVHANMSEIEQYLK